MTTYSLRRGDNFSLVIDCLASNGQKTTSRLQRLLWSATAGLTIILILFRKTTYDFGH